jgi:bifunctional non-homologous end joining protein LigD
MIVPNQRGGDFNAMQNSVGPKSKGIPAQHQFQVFDILYLDGLDLRNSRLIDRKAVLEDLLKDAPGYFQIVERIEGAAGPQVYLSACALKLEGIVSKVIDAPYRSGDRTDWQKVKCVQRANMVVIGYVPQAGGTVAALRLARQEGDRLVYAGKVGSGFSAKSGAEVRAKLEPLMRKASALSKPIKKPGTIWVESDFEAEVEFMEDTGDALRHPSFKGMSARKK